MNDMREKVIAIIDASALIGGCEVYYRSRASGRWVYLMKGLECKKCFYLGMDEHSVNIQAIPDHIKTRWDSPHVGAGETFEYAEYKDMVKLANLIGGWTL